MNSSIDIENKGEVGITSSADIKRKDKIRNGAIGGKNIVLIIMTLSASGILALQGWTCLSKYLTKATMVRERIEPIEVAVKNKESPFIGMFVCPDYDSAYKHIVLSDYGINKTDYRTNGIFIPKNNEKKIDANVLFHLVTHELNEILKTVVIRTRLGNTSNFIIEFDNPNHLEHIDIETKFWPSFGRCYSLLFKNHVLEQGVTYIDAYARLSIYIYLTHPGHFTHINSKTKAYTGRGKRAYQDSMYSISINTLEHLCNPKMNLEYDNWFYQKVARENERKLNCTCPFHPPVLSQVTGQEIEICKEGVKGKIAISEIGRTSNREPRTPETKPCSEMKVLLAPPMISSRNIKDAYIRLYIKSDVKIKNIILYYDANSLFADLGGYIGMILGISIMDLIIICNSAWSKVILTKLQRP